MNNNNIFRFGIIGLLIFLLGSCGKEDVLEETVKKHDFYLEIQNFSELPTSYTLEKTAKIEAAGEISLHSQVGGRVQDILVREGEKVIQGQPLVRISDTVANLGTSLSQSQLNLEQSKITYETNKINLEKAIFDAQLNVEKLEKNYIALESSINQNLIKAQNDLDNSSTTIVDSKSSLDIQKLDNSIEKMELDYNNKIIADQETLLGFLSTLKKDQNSLLIIIDDVIEFGDTLLGVTDLNKDENESFDTYLGAKNTAQKRESEFLLKELIRYRAVELSQLGIADIQDLEQYLNTLDLGYETIKTFLNSMEHTLNNSIESINSLSAGDIASYVANINSYQANLQANYSAFISFDNSVKSFLRTYENTQASLQKQIDLAKKDKEILIKALSSGEIQAEVGYNNTVINSNDALVNLEIQIKNAKNALENAQKTKEVSLRSLQNSINNAALNVEKARKEVEKLTIRAPIDGVISDVFIDVGQEYSVGTQFVKLVGNNKREITLGLPIEELEKVSVGDVVGIDYRNQSFTGTLFSKSNLADDNLNYQVKISLGDRVDFIGGVAKITFYLNANHKLLPVNAVRILNTTSGSYKKGEINIYDSTAILKKEVEIGEVYGHMIEVIIPETGTGNIVGGEGNEDYKIIINDVKNYDKEKFLLKIKK